jgi:hypothetical protein
MTEKQWLACTDPTPMLGFLRGKASERKLRLFAVACCRRLGPLLQDTRITAALDVAERHTDGAATQADLEAALRAAAKAQHAQRRKALLFAYAAVMDACGPGGLGAAEKVAWAEAAAADSRATYGERLRRTRPDLYASLAALFREVLGNPFRSILISSTWRTAQLAALAQAAYDERELPTGTLDPARLAVLADALEDAGCTDPELLGHLRGPGEHVRGCWAVDLLLGKG